MKFMKAEPRRFHPYLVVEFNKKAVVTSDSRSFKTMVHNICFTISAQFLVEEFELSHSGTSIFTYLDGNPNIQKIHWNRWKLFEYKLPFTLGSPRGSLDQVSATMFDIVNKIIIHDVGAKSELSTRKYKPMRALDDEVDSKVSFSDKTD